VVALHRLLVIAVGLLLVGGNTVVCGSLAATPEARMACCSEGGDCPMHHGEHHSGSGQTLTQAQADACCTLSGQDRAQQTAPTLAAVIGSAVLGPGVVMPATVPSLVMSDGWRTATPIAIAPVPRHVLLSVFLV
jgi:hypothetical protein